MSISSPNIGRHEREWKYILCRADNKGDTNRGREEGGRTETKTGHKNTDSVYLTRGSLTTSLLYKWPHFTRDSERFLGQKLTKGVFGQSICSNFKSKTEISFALLQRVSTYLVLNHIAMNAYSNSVLQNCPTCRYCSLSSTSHHSETRRDPLHPPLHVCVPQEAVMRKCTRGIPACTFPIRYEVLSGLVCLTSLASWAN